MNETYICIRTQPPVKSHFRLFVPCLIPQLLALLKVYISEDPVVGQRGVVVVAPTVCCKRESFPFLAFFGTMADALMTVVGREERRVVGQEWVPRPELLAPLVDMGISENSARRVSELYVIFQGLRHYF